MAFNKEQSKFMGLHTELTVLATHAQGIAKALEDSRVELPELLIQSEELFIQGLDDAVEAHTQSYKRLNGES